MKRVFLLAVLLTIFLTSRSILAQPLKIGLGDWTYVLYEGAYYLSTDGKSPSWSIDTWRIVFETFPGTAVDASRPADAAVSFGRLIPKYSEENRYALQLSRHEDPFLELEKVLSLPEVAWARFAVTFPLARTPNDVEFPNQWQLEAAQLVTHILETRPHPEQGYRSCLGLLRLGKTHGPDRLEAAARRALHLRAFSYQTVKNILASGAD
jgi:hypothetical protein